ncbi:unnamed protein product [Peronospora destructor]|uniref:Uncharacterized protein n=1 Tax=Peronospora destructor TaxID=86335 RepID=A0AAV0UKQ9_9STRA|nr:unnamed protein product [Peronospora destructor]
MWMQKSVEGSSFSSSGNLHDRNRVGSQYAQGNSYNGNAAPVDTGDWKTKILESGQWLGGKVIEYGGKLARGPTTDAIPDHYGQQIPRNDGRANWMADIRSSSSSSYAGGNGSGGYTGGYQNDFVTERPKAYSDFSKGHSSTPSADKIYGGYDSKTVSSTDHHKSRHAKKKNEGKKSKKKNKKSKKKRQSDSEEESERAEMSISELSELESADEQRHKSKVKPKKKNTKKRDEFYSDESESEQESDKKKASENYSFSFDPAKLPPPPAEDQQKVTTKKTKSKKSKDKSGKKSRSCRHSVESTDNESTSEKEKSRTAKKRSSKKTASAASSASVDLLGVDLDVQSVMQPSTSGRPAQELQPSVFDAPQGRSPLQDLAGLSFAAHAQDPGPTQSSVSDRNVSATASNEAEVRSQSQVHALQTSMLPENNLVDLSSLVSEKKKTSSANPEGKRTLNDMQKARGANQPKPVMAMSMQGQQQQDTSGSMMQLNINQLQITDGATQMQQQMYPNMQMQQMPMQTQMAVMTHPQMRNIRMMHQQQFAQGSSDPFRQLP